MKKSRKPIGMQDILGMEHTPAGKALMALTAEFKKMSDLDSEPKAARNLDQELIEKFIAAMDEEKRLYREIDNIFSSVLNREEAGHIVKEKYFPKMDEADRRIKRIFDSMHKLDELRDLWRDC